MYYIFSIQQVSISISFIFIYQKPCSNLLLTARLSHPVQDYRDYFNDFFLVLKIRVALSNCPLRLFKKNHLSSVTDR